MTVLSVIGTRPEAIKMAPVIAELERYPDQVRSIVCVTAQHRDMLDQVLNVFAVKPDYDLDLMRPDQSLSLLTARLLEGLDKVVRQEKPDWILAQGDTTSVLVSALTAFYHGTPFGHVEAGLRTSDMYQPFPEEANRRLTDSLSSIWFAPTECARQSLLREGCPEHNVILTGNTVVDALHQILRCDYKWRNGPLSLVPLDKRLILVTVHRRESFGEPLHEICSALRTIAETLADEGVHLVCPVHPNPNVRGPVLGMLSGLHNVSLLEPLDYLSLIHLMRRTELVLTDSGGIQEEAPSLGVPVLVMRDKTERPEGINAGIARLVGTKAYTISSAAIQILQNREEYEKMIATTNPYGDGKAAERIVSELLGRGNT